MIDDNDYSEDVENLDGDNYKLTLSAFPSLVLDQILGQLIDNRLDNLGLNNLATTVLQIRSP
jgi:hypothetical protein